MLRFKSGALLPVPKKSLNLDEHSHSITTDHTASNNLAADHTALCRNTAALALERFWGLWPTTAVLKRETVIYFYHVTGDGKTYRKPGFLPSSFRGFKRNSSHHPLLGCERSPVA